MKEGWDISLFPTQMEITIVLKLVVQNCFYCKRKYKALTHFLPIIAKTLLWCMVLCKTSLNIFNRMQGISRNRHEHLTEALQQMKRLLMDNQKESDCLQQAADYNRELETMYLN